MENGYLRKNPASKSKLVTSHEISNMNEEHVILSENLEDLRKAVEWGREHYIKYRRIN